MTLAVAGARSQRRYDAAQTIEAFATRLREHTDLDALTSELLTVVDHTMQPTGCRCGSNRSGRPDAVIAVEGHMAEVVDYLRTVARASARSRSERWAEAAALWARVVERNPVNGNHWDRLAEARFGLGDYQGALAAYEKVLELGVWERRRRSLPYAAARRAAAAPRPASARRGRDGPGATDQPRQPAVAQAGRADAAAPAPPAPRAGPGGRPPTPTSRWRRSAGGCSTSLPPTRSTSW